MTNELPCSYSGDRDAALVEYLYAEVDPGARSAFAGHLATCPACRADVDALRGVRQALASWAPPEPMQALGRPGAAGAALAVATTPGLGETVAPPSPTAFTWSAVPAWARVAAAVLCVGVGLGAANLHVGYTADGLTVRTGWLSPAAAAVGPTAVGPTAVGPVAEAALREEMRTLEQTLRAELRSAHTPQPLPAVQEVPASDAVLRQVKALIARSELHQQNELALQMANLLNDVQAQRRADLSRIDRTIGVVQSNTGMEVLRQRKMIDTLAVQVSGQR